MLSSPFASAAPAVEAAAALSQPTLVAGAGLDNAFADATPASDHAAAKPAPHAAKARSADKPASQLSDWSMLLVGAGVLLLPRKRRIDNVVR